MTSCSEEEYFYRLDSMVIRSTQHLRQIFKQRWKVETEGDWRDETSYIQTFLNRHGKNIMKKAIPLQKKILLDSCSSDEWDISLMSFILLSFGDGNKYKLQNQAIRQLKDLRNGLAHHKSKKLKRNEYCEKVKIFKESLQMLDVPQCKIDKLIDDSSVSSSVEDTERLNILLKNAEYLINMQDFEGALSQYSEALSIPRLSSEILGNVYERRGACYLSLKDKHVLDVNYIEQAVLDVEQALTLNKSSWNALYLKAQCYKAKNNLSEAIRYYKMALAISPVPKQIKEDLDSCEILESIKNSNAYLNVDQLPPSENEIVGIDENGRELSVLKYAKAKGYQNVPVFLGKKYYYGLGVAPDYKKAVKYFTQADKQGYAEGCFMLGNCYYLGHGVKQSVSKSVEIFKRCAEMDPKKLQPFENSSPLGYNYSVASAEYGIGKSFEHGIGLEENLKEAVVWYTKAMEHGHGAAACCLAILYHDGQGLEKNQKMAEMCWKQGLNFSDVESAEYLAIYYRRQLEPEMAWNVFQIAREMGSSRALEMSDEEFYRDLACSQSERCRLEVQVKRFEKFNDFGFKGMTFRQRVSRMNLYCNRGLDQIGSSEQILKTGKNVELVVELISIHDNFVTMAQQERSVLERKEYIKSPVRKGLILQHRKRLRDAMILEQKGVIIDNSEISTRIVDNGVIPGKLQQKRPKTMAQLKSICLEEMVPIKHKIYENRVLDLTIIDDPNVYFNSIQLVAEDDNGNTTRVYVDTFERNDWAFQRFAVGSRIAVINPYIGFCAKSEINGIRVNEPKCIIFLEKVNEMCSFCGEENSTLKCSKCKRTYCSDECQKLDLELFDHKLICSLVDKNKTSKKYTKF